MPYLSRRTVPTLLLSAVTAAMGACLQPLAALAEEPAVQQPEAPGALTDAQPQKDADKPVAEPAEQPATQPASRRSPAGKVTPAGAAGKTDAAKADAKPAGKPRITRTGKIDPKSPIGQAIEEVRREYQRGKLRQDSTYFRDTPCEDLTTDIVFILLDRKMGTVAPEDAYVKWQLLSSLPTTLAAQYQTQVIAALNKAPSPLAMAGLINSDSQRQAMDKEARRFKEQQATAAMEKIDMERERIHTLNSPIISYREALAELLGDSREATMAAFGNAYQLALAGEDARKASDTAIRLANRWIATKPPKAALQQFADALVQVRDLELPEQIIRFDADPKQDGYTIRTERLTMDGGGRLRDLQVGVRRQLGGGADGDQIDQGAQDNQGRNRRRTR